MSVFICWSGDRSFELAKAVATLLRATIYGRQKAKDKDHQFFVSDRIEKGLNWFDTIMDTLQQAEAGIVCLTPENIDGAWLHFEAGALARRLATKSRSPLRRRLFPLLYRVNGAELRGPLGAYQGTSVTRTDMSQLVQLIAESLGKSLRRRQNIIPDSVWRQFEHETASLAVPVRSLVPEFDQLFQRKTFNEPMQKCTDRAWGRRYDGARITHEALRKHFDRVCRASSTHEQVLFRLLLDELDGYAMSLQALLTASQTTPENRYGAPLLRECEDRRLAVKSLVARLLEPEDEPLHEDSPAFIGADTPEERKLIVHRVEERIRQHRESAYPPAPGVTKTSTPAHTAIDRILEGVPPKSLRASSWDLDRIYYYLLIHYFGTLALRWERGRKGHAKADARPVAHECLCAIRDVEMEVERIRAKAKGASVMPLTYALAALEGLNPRNCADKRRVPQALKDALGLVDAQVRGVSPEEAAPIHRALVSLGFRQPGAERRQPRSRAARPAAAAHDTRSRPAPSTRK